MLPEQLVGDCANLHHRWGRLRDVISSARRRTSASVGPLGFTLPYFLTFSSLSPYFSRYEAIYVNPSTQVSPCPWMCLSRIRRRAFPEAMWIVRYRWIRSISARMNWPKPYLRNVLAMFSADTSIQGLHGGVDFGFSRIYNVLRLDENYEIAYEPTWVEV